MRGDCPGSTHELFKAVKSTTSRVAFSMARNAVVAFELVMEPLRPPHKSVLEVAGAIKSVKFYGFGGRHEARSV